MRTTLVAIAIVGGCGGGHGGSVAITDFASDYKRAECEWATSCGLFADIPTCVSENLGFRLNIDPNLIAAINAGKVIYNGAKASACLAAYATRSCDTTAEDNRVTPAACNELITGTVAGGGACALNDECVSLACSVPTCGAGMCCAGTCVGDAPPATEIAIGGACTGSSQCAAGGYCDSTQQCAALLAAGTACMASNQCAYGLGCTGGTCQVLPGPKQPCLNGACGNAGNYCDGTNTCVAYSQLGEACSQTTRCAPSQVCGTTGTCAEGPTATNGQTCTSTCADDGTFCDSQTMKCTPWLADGQPCTASAQCQSDACLSNGTAMACGEPPQCI